MPAVRTLLPLLALLLLAFPATAVARGGGDERPEVRANGTCGGSADSKLKLKARDGGIEVEFEIQHHRRAGLWRIVMVQEGRVAWRGRRRARSATASFEVSRRLRNLRGADRIMVRGLGPRGVTCVASATLPG